MRYQAKNSLYTSIGVITAEDLPRILEPEDLDSQICETNSTKLCEI